MEDIDRRKLRKSMGTRTSRRHGVKKGEMEKPKTKLQRLIRNAENSRKNKV